MSSRDITSKDLRALMGAFSSYNVHFVCVNGVMADAYSAD